MTRRIINKMQLLDNTLSWQGGKCPICDRHFNITIFNVVSIEAHHQTTKNITISKACNSSYNKAFNEFVEGSCVWGSCRLPCYYARNHRNRNR